MALELGVLMTLGDSVLMIQKQGVLPPIECPVLPFHKVKNLYEQLGTIGIFICCTFAS